MKTHKDDMEKQKVLFILGATGSGKSDLAVKLAKLFDGEIISADSVQIFKQFNIGSAKVTKDEMQSIVHYGIDLIEPNAEFTVYDYVEYTKKMIDIIAKKGKLPIVVGGTGLYVKSLIEGYNFGDTEKHSDYREELEKEIKKNGLESVYNKLLKLDEKLAKSLDRHNPVRVIRALEIAKFGSNKTKNNVCEYDFKIIATSLDRELLYKKINKRVDQMLESGLIDEVKAIYNRYGENLQPMKAIGYKEVLKYIKGEINLSEMSELIKKNTRNYAKRQLTFLRGLKDVDYIDNSNKEKALMVAKEDIEKWLK